jgi:N-acetylglucosamine-6-phosphate deacetylase
MTLLVAERIVTGDGGLTASPAWIVVDDARITAVGTGPPPDVDGDVVARPDSLLAPAYIDLQVNGVGSTHFATGTVDAIVAAVAALERGGCAACVPTLVSAPLDTYEPALERLDEARRLAPGMLGVHLEGPFLGGAPGAHPVELVRPVELDWLVALCDRFADLVAVVTLAPEADPGFAATRELAERGIVVSLGHTAATYDDARAAADAGARMVTHLFNGMSALHHRAPGVAGAALDDRRLVPSLIADLVHVHPVALRIALAARPDAVLVTDRVAGPPDVDAVRLADGTLAGSVVTMETSVRNLVANGVPVGAAVRAATGNPARVLGRADRGRIAAGCRSDLIWLDPDDLSLRARWPDVDRPGS